MNNEFEVFATIRAAWGMFASRPWFYIGITLLIFVIGWLVGFVSGFFNALIGQNLFGNAIGFALSFIGQMLLGMGTVYFFLRAHDGAAEAWNLWHPQPLWYYIGATLLNGIITVVGFILLIVPGIIFALMFFFTQYVVIDQALSPIAALKKSMHMTNGHKWKLLGFLLMLTFINVVGVICLIVGLLVSIPVTSLAIVHAYRTLSRNG